MTAVHFGFLIDLEQDYHARAEGGGWRQRCMDVSGRSLEHNMIRIDVGQTTPPQTSPRHTYREAGALTRGFCCDFAGRGFCVDVTACHTAFHPALVVWRRTPCR